ncbi:MarR family winged helix-turn-helix transcriptional regulator [Georgenia wangjunii]|uniref:MarR family winged helix-turn-helix transcriptional regulator n=1 Tax=Georgenia wangjunii TaxID=3117730 RepID=UPI002F26327C
MHDDPTGWPTGRLLSAAARRVERRWDAYLDQFSLSHASVPVLAMLARGDLSQRELADAMGVTEQTVSRMLVRLERNGYVRRAPHARDRRRHVVSLAESGREVLVRLQESPTVRDMSVEGLTAEEVAGLRAGLLAMLKE